MTKNTLLRGLPFLLSLALAGCGDAPFCGNDVHEPNNGAFGATPTTSLALMAWSDDDLVLCPGDEDWFAWTAPSLKGGVFVARWELEQGDIEIQAFDANGESLGFPGGNPDGGSVNAWVSSPEQVPMQGTVRVERVDEGLEPLGYSLQVELDSCCNN